MRHYKIIVFPCVLVIVLALLSSSTGIVQAASASGCGPWIVVHNPKLLAVDANFYGVTAIASNDVWAVGYADPGVGPIPSLIEHWDGSTWSVVNNPNPGTIDDRFFGVRAMASNDVWAVGSQSNSVNTNISSTLVEHWNGSAWSVVHSPNVGSGANVLNGVTTLSATDAWAAGYWSNKGSTANFSLIEHWDGVSWKVVKHPDPSTYEDRFFQVGATSANDIWAVGNHYTNGSQGPVHTLIEHWDGTQWSVVKSVNVQSSDDNLSGVVALSTSDVWAVGQFSKLGGAGNAQTLVEHWDGTQWSIVPSPNVSFSLGLDDVAAVSATSIWAVGNAYNRNASVSRTVIEHWNGTSWSVVNSPNPTAQSFLDGVTALPDGKVWAVGEVVGNIIGKPLIESHC